jgi:pyrroloquinoline quinone biosynthesis protein E
MNTPNPTPLALVAELTHRCPLHCVYCSNPLELTNRSTELPTETWQKVFREAAELGVLQTDFTGGEPLARTDILELIKSARAAGLYVNLITSGLPMDEAKLAALVAAGVDHIQLSFQGADEPTAAEISNTKTHAQKLKVLEWFKQHRVAVTLNFVIHRRNIHQIPEMLAITESSSATRIEFANVQYYGYAFANRANLLPTRAQLDTSLAQIKDAQERLKGKIRIEYVVPDYYAKYPKPCVGGWGRKLMLIKPDGQALPCHAAEIIPNLKFENVKDHSLQEIWESSDAFQKFRGQDWMQEPCKSCDRREVDFGGCHCQALLITGDATATDPVCTLSPQREKIDAILTTINNNTPQVGARYIVPSDSTLVTPPWLYRPNPS